MKLKLAISLAVPALIMLGSTGCVTSTNSYTRDIVYRDGSYYSPADEQYGDYYYAPEPEYSYYDDYPYYGYGSSFYYGSPWYSGYDSYRCRFSYHHDRDCDNGWNNFFFSFGGLTLIIGNSHYYGYGHGYPYYGYYGNHDHHPSRPDHRGPIPMPKPRRPDGLTPDLGFNNGPGMRVPGEPIRMPTKPGLVDQNPVEPINEPDRRPDLNPYTRTREPRRSIRPETWRNGSGENDNEEGIAIGETGQPRPVVRERAPPRVRPRPAPIVDGGDYGSNEKPIRQDHTQPYPVVGTEPSDIQPAPAPRIQTRERVERAERVERNERSERPAPVVNRETRKEGSDDR